jgi:hypothetical protein
MPWPILAQSHVTLLWVITKVELPYHIDMRSTTAPLTRAQIETDLLFTSVFVKLNYRIQEKKIVDALCWLQGKTAHVLGEEEYFDSFYLAQLGRAIQYQTNVLNRVWNDIVRLCSTYESGKSSKEEE